MPIFTSAWPYFLSTFPRYENVREDLPLLIDDINRCINADRKPTSTLTQDSLLALQGYPWPGNVRELSNLLERLGILFPGRTVGIEDLPHTYRGPAAQPDLYSNSVFPPTGMDLREHLSAVEQGLIRSAMNEADGTVAQAARLLNLRRTTLVEKLRRYSLHTESSVGELQAS